METVHVKLRKIGTSVGVIIPKEQLKEVEATVGDEIEIAILSHKKDFSLFGIAKGFTEPFVRDKKVRLFY